MFTKQKPSATGTQDNPLAAKAGYSITLPWTNMQTISIDTQFGAIRGFSSASGSAFLGIPYAAPPVGELRWRPPQRLSPWNGERDTLSFSPACPQPAMGSFGKAGAISEDCLYLNVWTPSVESSNLPVLVWLHGGAFTQGKGSQGIFNGAQLAKRGVVVVTLNYRLGYLGFLAHPELSTESGTNCSGNYGLLDQIAALEWVNENIAYFGGNPDNVTLMGQSSGGISTCAHMLNQEASRFFHKAIAMSAFVTMSLRCLQRRTIGGISTEEWGERFISRLGVKNIAIAREMPVDAILSASKAQAGFPGASTIELLSIEGNTLARSIADGFKQGLQAPIPFICGTTEDEGSLFSRKLSFPQEIRTPALEFMHTSLQLISNEERLRMLDLPEDTFKTELERIFSAGFHDSALMLAQTHSSIAEHTYLYRFRNYSDAIIRKGFGCFHGSELRYFFGNLPPHKGYEDVDIQLSNTIIEQIINFMHSGAPTGGNHSWKMFNSNHDMQILCK